MASAAAAKSAAGKAPRSLPLTESEFTPVDAIPGIVGRAKAAFATGRTRPRAWRVKQLKAVLKMCMETRDEIVAAIQADLRRSEFEVIIGELMTCVTEARFMLSNLDEFMTPEAVSTPLTQKPASSEIRREPLGTLLIISPWNFPINLCIMPMVCALAAGNTVVIKPSELSAASSRYLAATIPKYFGRDEVCVVQGAVPETTALLKERFDHILYTGGGSVGRHVMAAAAKHLTPVTLELGGKSPVVVDKSADIAVAAKRILSGKLLNNGQVCVAPDYALVHKDVEGKLVEELCKTLREWYGDEPQAHKDLGRIINARHHARISALIDGHKGGVAAGGKRDEADLYIEPTVLTNPDPESAVMRDEIFGPVLPVMAVEDLDAAVRFINGREKPLALYVFASDKEAQEKVLSATSSGGACVNECVMHLANPNLPFGGVGESGMGAYHGKSGFDMFSHKKAVLVKGTWPDPDLRYPPFTDGKLRILGYVLGGMPKLPGGKVGVLAALVAAGVIYSRVGGASRL